MPSLATRFEAKVDRSGDHHLWTGVRYADGSGLIKANGKPTTVRRVAWELEHGALPSGGRVLACPDHPACVRVDHLSLRDGVPSAGSRTARRRASRESGSKRQVRPGVWKLTVTAGRWEDGTPRRVHRTVAADNAAEASAALADFVAEVRSAPPPDGKSTRDITVDEAVERLLVEHLVGEKGREEIRSPTTAASTASGSRPRSVTVGCATSTRRPSTGCSAGCAAPASARRA